MAKQSPRQLLEFALIFGAIYLLSNTALKYFYPEQFGGEPPKKAVTLSLQDATLRGGHHPVLIIKNTTVKELPMTSRCPLPPVEVFFSDSDATVLQPLTPSEEPALPCPDVATLKSGETTQIDLGPWKYSLFSRYGTYEARLTLPEGFQPSASGSVLSARFTLQEEGPHLKLFRTFITKPFPIGRAP